MITEGHHFYIARGDETAAKALPGKHLHFVQLGVDDARSIKELHSRAATEGKLTSVISASLITNEAQNALLKVAEELPANTYLVLVVPSLSVLLDTVRSRALEISLEEVSTDTNEAKDFIKASPAARRDLLKDLIEKESNDEAKREQRERAIKFLMALEAHLAKERPGEAWAESLERVSKARALVTEREVATGIVIEQLCLTLA